MSLIALLRVIEYGWSQEKRAENVQHVVETSTMLQQELEAWFTHCYHMRETLDATTTDFNSILTIYETTILPRILELKGIDGGGISKGKPFSLKPLRTHLLSESVLHRQQGITHQAQIPQILWWKKGPFRQKK